MLHAIFFTDLDPELVDVFLQHKPADLNVTVERPDADPARKRDLVRTADFLILFPGRIEDDVLRAGENLRLINLVSAGFEHMNLDLCRAMGIPVANNGGTNAIDVAEHTLALMLGAYRRLVVLDGDVRGDRWDATPTGQTTYTIHGKTVGIVGLGHIGRRVASLLRSFSADLLYTDAFPADATVEEDLSVSRVNLSELLDRSDIVTLHVPLNDQTQHMIGPEQLARMKATALLVNTCRGSVIDEPALVRALLSGRPAFAALDVLEEEPPDPESPMLQLENVLLTPHTAGITRDTWERRGEFVFANMERVRSGERPYAEVT